MSVLRRLDHSRDGIASVDFDERYDDVLRQDFSFTKTQVFIKKKNGNISQTD